MTPRYCRDFRVLSIRKKAWDAGFAGLLKMTSVLQLCVVLELLGAGHTDTVNSTIDPDCFIDLAALIGSQIVGDSVPFNSPIADMDSPDSRQSWGWIQRSRKGLEYPPSRPELMWMEHLTSCEFVSAMQEQVAEEGAFILFDDARSDEPGFVAEQAWVFTYFTLDPAKDLIFREMLVAVHSMRTTGQTRRKIIILTDGSVPRSQLTALQSTGCCQLRIMTFESFGDLSEHSRHCRGSPLAKNYVVFQLFGLEEFERVVLINTDVLVLAPGIDDIFAFPLPGFHFGGAVMESGCDYA